MKNPHKTSHPLIELIINEYNVMLVILLNTLVLFFDEFPLVRERTSGVLIWIDYGCIIYFVIEAALKIYKYSPGEYFASWWNRFDFAVVIASLPSLLMPFVGDHSMDAFLAISVLRLGRLFRFFRLLRFIPNIQHIMQGVTRALRASVGMFLALIILNLTLAIGATMLFGKLAPAYFGDPLISAYSLFKVFTVEGWYDIPDELAKSGQSFFMIALLRGYFILSVLVGGILGVSLANAIFVDEMTADNTLKVERMVAEMHQNIAEMHQKDQHLQQLMWQQIREEMQHMQKMIEKLNTGPNDRRTP